MLEKLTGYVYTEDENAALLKALDVDDHERVYFESFSECFEFELDNDSKRSMVLQTKKSSVREQSLVSRAFAARVSARYRSSCREVVPLQTMWDASAAMRARGRMDAQKRAMQTFRSLEKINAPSMVCEVCMEPFAFDGDLRDHIETGECDRRRAFVAAYPCCFGGEDDDGGVDEGWDERTDEGGKRNGEGAKGEGGGKSEPNNGGVGRGGVIEEEDKMEAKEGGHGEEEGKDRVQEGEESQGRKDAERDENEGRDADGLDGEETKEGGEGEEEEEKEEKDKDKEKDKEEVHTVDGNSGGEEQSTDTDHAAGRGDAKHEALAKPPTGKGT